MPTVAIVHFPASGHIRPILPLVTALNEAGVHTVQWGPADWEARCRAAGGEFRALPDWPSDLGAATPRPFVVARMVAAFAERWTQWMCEQLADARPDVVLRDGFAIYAHYAAREQGLDQYAIPAMMAFHRGCLPGARDAPAFAAGLLRGARDALELRQISRRLERRYGHGLGSPLDVFAGRLGASTFVLTLASLQLRPGGLRGEDVRYIGPLRALGPDESEDEPALHGLDPDERLIYVSLGTVFEQRPAFFRTAAEALAGPGRRVILSIGRTPPEALQPLPPGVLARAEVDQLAVLRRADLFVTHAGFNSVQEGLAAGLPLVLCPQTFEQAMNADVVVAHGAGVRARGGSVRALGAAAERALADPSCRRAAQRLAAAMRSESRVGEAVELLAGSARRHAAEEQVGCGQSAAGL